MPLLALPFPSWWFISHHPGLFLVLLGVIGEIVFEWKEMGKGRKALWLKASASMLIVGLLLEFLEAADSDELVAETQLHVEELRRSNDALKAEVQWRTITPEQSRTLLDSLNDLRFLPKCRVSLITTQTDVEAVFFMRQIANIFKKAGFDVKAQSTPFSQVDMGDNPDAPLPTGLSFIVKYNIPAPPVGAVEALLAFRKAGIDTFFGINEKADEDTLWINVFHKPPSGM